jgi:hypothetical protein
MALRRELDAGRSLLALVEPEQRVRGQADEFAGLHFSQDVIVRKMFRQSRGFGFPGRWHSGHLDALSCIMVRPRESVSQAASRETPVVFSATISEQ